jgi:hypothetical protein
MDAKQWICIGLPEERAACYGLGRAADAGGKQHGRARSCQ